MNHTELKTKIDIVANGIQQALEVDANSPSDKVFGALLLAGISVLGELILDVKRIADAAEKLASSVPGVSGTPGDK